MNCYKRTFLIGLATCAAIACLSYAQDKRAASAAVTPASHAESKEWPTYGHDSGGMRYSPLTQITPANVSNLKVAWTFHLKPEGYVAPTPGRGGGGGGRGGSGAADAGAAVADAAGGRGGRGGSGGPGGAPAAAGRGGGGRGAPTGFRAAEVTPL